MLKSAFNGKFSVNVNSLIQDIVPNILFSLASIIKKGLEEVYSDLEETPRKARSSPIQRTVMMQMTMNSKAVVSERHMPLLLMMLILFFGDSIKCESSEIFLNYKLLKYEKLNISSKSIAISNSTLETFFHTNNKRSYQIHNDIWRFFQLFHIFANVIFDSS